VAIVVFASRNKASVCHESHTISGLWTFENISEGNSQSWRGDTIAVFLFPQNYHILDDTGGVC
jgi:hypothetical protein